MFDEVLGTRAVVTMPGVLQSDDVKSGSDSTNTEVLDVSGEDSHGASGESDTSTTSRSPHAEIGSKRKKGEDQKHNKKVKKGRVTAAAAMIDLTEKLVKMQSQQMKTMERTQSRTEEVLFKLEAEQRKLDEESRGRN